MLTRTKTLTSGLSQMAQRCVIPQQYFLKYPLRIGFGFCEGKKWKREEFKTKLQSEIIDLQKNMQPTVPQNQEYFKKHSWSINYLPEKALFQYEKKEGEHDIKVITPVKHTPPNSEDPQQLHSNTDETKKLNYSKANVYIRKEGNEKWFTAQMAIFDGSVELLTLSFTKQPLFTWTKSGYTGPELLTLPQAVTEGVSMVFKQFGITTEVLINMVIHASSKVQQLEVAWLRQLKQVWA